MHENVVARELLLHTTSITDSTATVCLRKPSRFEYYVNAW